MLDLFFKKYGDIGEPIVIVHGIFGSLDNWHTVAQMLSTHYQVYTLDMRNHGHSPHSSKMSIDLMVADILRFLRSQNLKKVSLIGHSMGGKVALRFSLMHPTLIKKLIVVDIAPKTYKAGHTPYFDAYKQIDLGNISNRKDLDAAFMQYEENEGVRLFLMKNVISNGNGAYMLKINVQGIENGYQDIIGAINLEKTTIPTLFIKGANSNYINQEDIEQIAQYFTNVKFESIANAGHWVHAENRDGFLAVVNNFLS